MNISIENESGIDVDLEAIVSVAEYAMTQMGLHEECEAEILLVGEDRISELHVQWMDLPGPTDVLSFPMDELEPNSASEGPGILGDIVLCPQFAEKQAKKGLAAELHLLTVHGVLHCLGYDHAEPEEEREMFTLQERLLSEWEAKK